jgi:hypothetical protein
MKDVWWDYGLVAMFLWIAYDNLFHSHERFEFWIGVVMVVLTTMTFIRGTLTWIKLRRQRANPASPFSK